MLFAHSIRYRESQLNKMISSDPDAEILHETESYDAEDLYHCLYSIGNIALLVLIGAITLMSFENLSFSKSIYLIIASATTLGYGDLYPKKEITRLIMAAWLVFATISVANFIAEVTRFSMKAKQRDVVRRCLTVPIDGKSLRRLDRNSTGKVSWGEFLSTMLVSTGQINQRDIDVYRKRFQELDPNMNDEVSFDRENQQDIR